MIEDRKKAKHSEPKFELVMPSMVNQDEQPEEQDSVLPQHK